MVNRIRQFWDNRRDNINDFRRTIISELIKGSIISVLTIICLYLIRTHSPGNYEGVNLENYLEKCILKNIATEK